MALGAFLGIRDFECSLCQGSFTLLSGDLMVPETRLCDECLVELWPLAGDALKMCVSGHLAQRVSQQGESPESPDQLQEEMRRWVAGEDDWHDRVVNEYKSRVTARHEAEQEERRRRAALLRKRLEHQEADGDLPTTPLIGYTQEQLAALLEKRSPGAPGARRVIQGSQFGKQAHLYERYLKRQASSGLLTPELEVKEGTDLTDEIAGRSVPFSSDAGD